MDSTCKTRTKGSAPLTCGISRTTSMIGLSRRVSRGVNAMPAWGGVLKPAEVEALWAYVCEGEK